MVLHTWVGQPHAVHGCGGQSPDAAHDMGTSVTWFVCQGGVVVTSGAWM